MIMIAQAELVRPDIIDQQDGTHLSRTPLMPEG